MKRYTEDEVYFIVKNNLNMDLSKEDLTSVKLLFIKQYSARLIERVKFLINRKMYFILPFYNNDSIEHIDDKNPEILLIDTLSLYSFKIKKEKYYLCFSIIYNKETEGLKEEKVEFFIKS